MPHAAQALGTSALHTRRCKLEALVLQVRRAVRAEPAGPTAAVVLGERDDR
jgi:hypothetical protein